MEVDYNQVGKTVKLDGKWNPCASGFLCDRRISLRITGKEYLKVVRPAMMIVAETYSEESTREVGYGK